MSAPAPSRLTSFLLLRPTFAILLLGAFVLVGLLGYGALVRESTPDLEIPQATVIVEWPGADPETIENQVANKLETELKAMPGLRKLRSASFDSFCVITVEFDPNLEIATAMSRLRAEVSAAEAELPDETRKPKINEVSVNNAPIISMSFYGDIAETARGRALDELERQLEKIKGVNEVTVSGQRDEVVRVRLLSSRLDALGLSGTTVRQRLVDASRDQPWDRYESATGSIVLVMRGRMRTLDMLRQTPVARLAGGRVVLLSEVADVEFGLERERSRAFISTDGGAFAPAVDVSVTRLSGADAIGVASEVKAAVEAARSAPTWPAGLDYVVSSDQSIDIDRSLSDGFRNAMQAMAAVFVVLLVILTWREALIAGLAVPVTFMATLGVVWALGYTLNDLIVIGMILALGLLVDVFILMMEGMHEAIYERGKSTAEAALSTVRTYAMPALAGQLTTIFALAPLLAIGGTDGKFIRFIPLTAIICLVLSYIVALLICVPLSRWVLPREAEKVAPSRVDRFVASVAGALENLIRRSVVRTRLRAAIVAGTCFTAFLAAMGGVTTLPSLLYPDTDVRDLGITITLPPDTGLSASQRCADEMGEALRHHDYLASVTKFVGRDSPFARTRLSSSLTPDTDTYIVGFSIKFTPKEEREHLSAHYMEPLRESLDEARAACPGARIIFAPQAQGGADWPIEIVASGSDLESLRTVAASVRTELSKVSGAVDISDNIGEVRPTLEATPDLEALDFFGISVGDFAAQVRLGFAEDEALKFPLGEARDDLEIRIGTAWPSRKGKAGGPTNRWEALAMTVVAPNGQTVPLRELVTLRPVHAPLSIIHKDGVRAVSITARVSGITAGEILEQLKPQLDEIRQAHPDIELSLAGEAESQAETFGSALSMLGVAAFLVFAVLVIQFDSFRQPIAMMFVVPLSLTGTFVFFLIFYEPISFPALIGIISLIGIVVNNAIVMISAMNELRREGMSVAEAAAVGASGRLRPIVSTTITTLVGMVPLALSDPQWFPLAGAIIGGLMAGTVFAMVATPAMYLLVTSSKPPRDVME